MAKNKLTETSLISEDNILAKLNSDRTLNEDLSDKFLLPLDSFIKTNECLQNLDNSENMSFQSEKLPEIERWKVYPFAPIGSLDELLNDYFKNSERTARTLNASQ